MTVDQLQPWHATLLDPTERARAAAYVRSEDRDRFVLGAAMLRRAAGGWTGLAPELVEIRRSCKRCGRPHGPPKVAGVGPWSASISHSGRHVVLAVNTGGPVGIDIESPLVRDLDPAKLAPLILGPGEEVPRDVVGILRTWVRKEALVKLTGYGLELEPRNIRLSAVEQTPRVHSAPEVLRGAEFRDLTVANDAVAALAVFGCIASLTVVPGADRPSAVSNG